MGARRSLVPILALLAAGCAAGAPSSPAPAAPPEPAEMIPPAEVRAGPQTNCSELLRVLRPDWRGLVYVDGVRLGSMQALEWIPVEEVERVELGRMVAAGGHEVIAILVTSRRRR